MEDATARELRRRREEAPSPFVLRSDASQKAPDPTIFSHLARKLLDSAGQENISLQDLRVDYVRRMFDEHD